ncbi:hypothetical protein [Polyangium sp. y55x31]|uniref:hypothetical protein n=1 Tax=Polyangium sp. y55x31 TaxID=3042688 RepID=UPI002482EC45|nr:hypothetical protein [Polyangium sp. y55x31]MDI1483667.1 hypothetical protein [Polyangium sp. y55x31]
MIRHLSAASILATTLLSWGCVTAPDDDTNDALAALDEAAALSTTDLDDPPELEPCRSVPADATLTLTSGTHGVSSNQAWPTDASHPGCVGYIADFVASGSSTYSVVPSATHLVSNPDASIIGWPQSEDLCKATTASIAIYSKATPQSLYTHDATLSYKGNWKRIGLTNNFYCEAMEVYGQTMPALVNRSAVRLVVGAKAQKICCWETSVCSYSPENIGSCENTGVIPAPGIVVGRAEIGALSIEL